MPQQLTIVQLLKGTIPLTLSLATNFKDLKKMGKDQETQGDGESFRSTNVQRRELTKFCNGTSDYQQRFVKNQSQATQYLNEMVALLKYLFTT